MTHEQWKARYTKLREIAEHITAMRLARARKACQQAGLDPSLLGIHPHNAMLSFKAGKPWPEVNYSKARLCLRILGQESASTIVSRWDRKVRQ